MEQFASGGPLVMTIRSTFDFVAGYIKKVVAGSLFETFTSLGPAFANIAEGLKQSSEAGAKSSELALERIPILAELAAEKAAESMGNIPENFKENMAGVPPLFTDLEKHQQEIDRLQQGITKSTKETTEAVSELDKENAKAEQEARKYFDEYKKGQAQALKDAEKSAKDDAEKQAKLQEVLELKRQEHNAQLGINNAIAAGNFQEAEALKNAQSLKKTIDDLVKIGFGESEATKMANEMGRAARDAERIQKSLATKIDQDIKSKQKADAIDKGGATQKKVQTEMEAGRYATARALGKELAEKELNVSVRGFDEKKDRRAAADILKDYYGNRAPVMSDKERLELTRLAREEGVFKDFSKMTDSTKKGLDRFADRVFTETLPGESLKTAEKRVDDMIRGVESGRVGFGRDTRSIKEIGSDYGLKGTDEEIRKELYKIRTEGQGDKLKKGTEDTQKSLGKNMKTESDKKVEENKTPMTLDTMVKSILTLIEKIEPKLPQQVLA